MRKIFFIISIFFLKFSTFNPVVAAENEVYKKIDLFGEVLEKINKEYVDEINQSESMDAAIDGLLQSLDPYSAYMSPEIFNEMQKRQRFDSKALSAGAKYALLVSPFLPNEASECE